MMRNTVASLLLYLCLSIFADVGHSESEIGEFFEECGFYQSLRTTADSPIRKLRSKYQDIEIHRSKHYGNILVLDGVLQLTERDANAYNEMLAHVPLFQHNNPKRVLILGGGDGYVLSEVLKHESVEQVDHCDLDDKVIETCKEFFPWGKAWEDPRVKLYVADGAAFARDALAESYDVIIQDSSDPWTVNAEGEIVPLPSSALYEKAHFHNLHRILKPEGILNFQAETFTLPSDLEGIVNWRQQALETGFPSATYGSLYISSYPTGQIGFLLCEKSPGVATMKSEIQRRFQQMEQAGQGTSYYHPRLQQSSFDLPLWVHRTIYGSDSLDSVCPDVSEAGDEQSSS
ncbi:Polyamine aminopropyltransferase [Seminavis robusta]|uniref:Polyamine aminopropyltransferase n=1 Tax=Seminavis robusta TaxID=568900 RepID=A0A9N8EKW3_9STRA|nr:Polyamine aminopropyltransferase [Seminavis robusta]|eukprot:Sro1440_g272870.1 Polyamine aminopropyltransferase (345) ;mRNA; r:13282-14402